MSDTEKREPEIPEHLRPFLPQPLKSNIVSRELLLALIPEGFVSAGDRFLQGLIRARDRDWGISLKAVEVFQWRLGMEDAAKVMCSICHKGEKPVGHKENEAASRNWVHEVPGDKEKSRVRCTAAPIYEILEPKK